MNAGTLQNALIAFTDRQYQSHAAKDLRDFIFSNHVFRTLDAGFLDFATRHRSAIIDHLGIDEHVQALAEHFVHSTNYFTFKRNQFIQFPKNHDTILLDEYRRYLGQIRHALIDTETPGDLSRLVMPEMQAHFNQLIDMLMSIAMPEFDDDSGLQLLVTTFPCGEYSAEFQTDILNITIPLLNEPILDIGCGSDGTLVKRLTAGGHEAFGLDRCAPDAPGFFLGNWMDFDFIPDTWGTIIAHQSFSTHFMFNHLYRPDAALVYAKRYMAIIESLKTGGEFLYAPGLPFMEKHIAGLTRFEAATSPVPRSKKPETAGDISYSTSIRKC